MFAFRWTGAALACGVMSFPLLVRPIRLSIEAIDRRLEQAASTLGAAPWKVFATVTLPLALPGILAGMVLGFAKAIGEFGATITFVSNIPGETQTISSAIYSLIQTPGRRRRGGAAGHHLHRDRDGRADCVGMVRAARHAAPAWKLTMLRVEVAKQLGEFSLEASFTSEGRVTGLFGASGAGKTSLINMIAGLLRPDRGVISLDGEILDDTDSARARAAAPPPHRLRVPGRAAVSASQCAAKSRLWAADEPPRRGSRAAHAASPICSTSASLLDRRPGKLSGGERQRVALGRALLSKPRLLLLDEPLGSLDEGRKVEILPYLVRLRDEANVPMVYVSHDPAELRQLATQIVMLRNGRVTALGGVKVLTGQTVHVTAPASRRSDADKPVHRRAEDSILNPRHRRPYLRELALERSARARQLRRRFCPHPPAGAGRRH